MKKQRNILKLQSPHVVVVVGKIIRKQMQLNKGVAVEG